MPIPRLLRLAIALLSCLIPAAAFGADANVRADFLKLIDRGKVPPEAEVTPLPNMGSLKAFHFTFASDATNRVPGILLEPPSPGPHPVVIALHGTGGTKTGELPLLRLLAAKGFISVAMDAPYHGERCKAGKGTADYDAAIFLAWKDQSGHPFYYETVWDQMRLIDYLSTRDDVDPARIGMIGISKGGVETYLTAAADPRIAVAVPCIGLQSFKWELDNNDWQTRISTIQAAFDSACKASGVTHPDSAFVHQFYDRVVPGIDGEFDGPAMVLQIAPRPMMVINGGADSHTPLPSLKLCTDAAQQAYHAAGLDDHFKSIVETGIAHKVTADSQAQAIGWFVKWLKP